MSQPDFDVVVLGGGLAGLCVAIELKRKTPDVSVLVLDKAPAERPEGAFKVGESSVEVASHYFRNVLGLSNLLKLEVPKFGLRFFMSNGDNRDVSKRFEYGPKKFLTMPSDQIDRGQFENGLAREATALGVELRCDAEIQEVEVAASGSAQAHNVRYVQAPGARGGESETFQVTGRWLVDASGRKGFLKQRLGLAQPSRHKVNAVWFRIDEAIDLDDWSDDEAWRARVESPRRQSTNHLLGPGYWVWFIPLAHGRTSVGIVADDKLHAFSKLNTFDRAMRWLAEFEPQAAEVIASQAENKMDFLAQQKCAHEAKQVFSPDRWALTGDAGIFIDPLYSPGSDFIGISNGFICDLIRREMAGEAIDGVATEYDQAYRSLARTYSLIYLRQYPLMGHPRVMVPKIIWDFTNYWGGVAKPFCGDRMCNAEFMARARPLLQGFAYTNLSMQSFFREWAALAQGDAPPGSGFIDYAGIDFLAQLNAALGDKQSDDELLASMEANLELIRNLKLEIIAEASIRYPSLRKEAEPAETHYLDGVFESLRCAVGRSA